MIVQTSWWILRLINEGHSMLKNLFNPVLWCTPSWPWCVVRLIQMYLSRLPRFGSWSTANSSPSLRIQARMKNMVQIDLFLCGALWLQQLSYKHISWRLKICRCHSRSIKSSCRFSLNLCFLSLTWLVTFYFRSISVFGSNHTNGDHWAITTMISRWAQ